jgi:hypothetical protein
MLSRMNTFFKVVAVLGLLSVGAPAAQTPSNPRLGTWKMKTDAAPPPQNMMIYEPYGNGGMRVTVDNTSPSGRKAHWTYVTMFDGKDMPVEGHPNADTTSVRKVDDRTTEIVNKKGGRVVQTITNVISPDGNRIDNTYKNYNEKGELTSTTTAVYERVK